MKLTQPIAWVLTTALWAGPLLVMPAQAAAPTSLSLSATAGDAVQVAMSGAPNGNILLSFLPPGALNMTTVAFGTTDSNGNFSSVISSGGYGIPSGSPVFTSINGVQSITMLWPIYTSSLTLSQGSAQIAVGQSVAITGTNTLILAANSLPASIAAAVNGSSLAITGLSAGSGTVAVCGINVGCSNVTVAVGGQAGQTQITFNPNNAVLNSKETRSVSIFGGSNNGYTVKSNSNAAALDATIAGTSGFVTLYGKETPGTAAVVICSQEASSNCATLNVTVLNNSTASLSFSQNNVSLIPGLAQPVTVSGGPDSNYYIYSNSNSGVVGATMSGNTLTVTGGSNAGTAVIAVCSATVSNSCGNLNITTNLNNVAPSATVLAFSQNVVAINAGDNSNVTVTGGPGGTYVISSNSNPTAVTTSISSGSNVINLKGNAVGSAIISVCSSATNTTCANLAVNVNPALLPIYFTKNNVALTTDQSVIVGISGGNDTNKIVSSNSYPSVAAASIGSGGSLITLTGGSVSGAAVITVCSASAIYSNNCATLNVTNTATPAAPTISELVAINTPTANRAPNYTFSADKAGTIVYGGDCSSSTVNASAGNNTVMFNTLSAGLHSNCTIKVVDATGRNSNQINVSAFTVNAPASAPAPAPALALAPAGQPALETPVPTAKVLGVNNYKFTRTLNLGATGQEVSELQKVLKKLGYFTYPSITGLFGALTKQAVAAFQKAKNLKPYPGWVGPATRQALNNL